MSALFAVQRDKLSELLPDLGERVGYDGKAIESYSTGNKIKNKTNPLTGEQQTSDPDAAWGCHKQYTTGSNGKEKQVKKYWFGYCLHVLSDVNFELPLGFELAPAHESEHIHCTNLIAEFIDSDLSNRCQSFVADRGLDSNKLRKQLFEADILPVIDTRNLWDEINLDPDQLDVPTRALDENVIDTMLVTERGDLYCKCPHSKQIRLMHHQGYEKKRGTVKWLVRLRSTISSARVEPNATKAAMSESPPRPEWCESKWTRTTFETTVHCRLRPTSGNGCIEKDPPVSGSFPESQTDS